MRSFLVELFSENLNQVHGMTAEQAADEFITQATDYERHFFTRVPGLEGMNI